MLVKSYQFTGIDFGHLGQVVPNNMKQSGTYHCSIAKTLTDVVFVHNEHVILTRLKHHKIQCKFPTVYAIVIHGVVFKFVLI